MSTTPKKRMAELENQIAELTAKVEQGKKLLREEMQHSSERGAEAPRLRGLLERNLA